MWPIEAHFLDTAKHDVVAFPASYGDMFVKMLPFDVFTVLRTTPSICTLQQYPTIFNCDLCDQTGPSIAGIYTMRIFGNLCDQVQAGHKLASMYTMGVSGDSSIRYHF